MNEPFPESLKTIATQSLTANIIDLKSGSYLTAGRNQFKTLWTRDFCLSARGLLHLGRSDVVAHHLSTLIKARRLPDGLVPRVLDSMPTRWRVSLFFVAKILPIFNPDFVLDDPLKPEYQDEHGSEAIDSNLLVLLASLQLLEKTGNQTWWNEHEDALVEIFNFYKNKLDDGLITQKPFSDWQDSTRRDGKTFYTNLLYAVASEKLLTYPKFKGVASDVSQLKVKIESLFLEPKTGLFMSILGLPFISVDGNLLAIDLEFYPQGSVQSLQLYQNLKKHILWTGSANVPGFVTVPNYPTQWKTLAVQACGLHGYHDRLYWSWLMGLSAKVALLCGDADEGARILKVISALAVRDHGIAEVFEPKSELPIWCSRFFRAEMPFSWGSAFILDALSLIEL